MNVLRRTEFKRALIEVIEYLIQNELSSSSIQLIIHYFNLSKEKTIQSKAQETIEKYIKDKIFSEPISDKKLRGLVENMINEAMLWEKQLEPERERNKFLKITL